MSEKYGKIVQVIGPVVDVMFDGDGNVIPPIYTALKVVRPDGTELILEVEPVSYTHLTLPTTTYGCRSRWSPYQ